MKPSRLALSAIIAAACSSGSSSDAGNINLVDETQVVPVDGGMNAWVAAGEELLQK